MNNILIFLRLVSVPNAVSALLSHVDLSRCDVFPISVFSVVDQALASSYSRIPDELATSLEMLRLLEEIIASIPTSRIIQLVSTMENSLCCWLRDERSIVPDAEYNDIVCNQFPSIIDILTFAIRLIMFTVGRSMHFGDTNSTLTTCVSFHHFFPRPLDVLLAQLLDLWLFMNSGV